MLVWIQGTYRLFILYNWDLDFTTLFSSVRINGRRDRELRLDFEHCHKILLLVLPQSPQVHRRRSFCRNPCVLQLLEKHCCSPPVVWQGLPVLLQMNRQLICEWVDLHQLGERGERRGWKKKCLISFHHLVCSWMFIKTWGFPCLFWVCVCEREKVGKGCK